MVVVTYDVTLEDAAGVRRLRKVAKVCENVGQRVQKSVFECLLDPAQLIKLKSNLLEIIDPEKDSIRIYILGKKWDSKIEHYGVKLSYEQGETIIL